jgi:hypothetical protein
LQDEPAPGQPMAIITRAGLSVDRTPMVSAVYD